MGKKKTAAPPAHDELEAWDSSGPSIGNNPHYGTTSPTDIMDIVSREPTALSSRGASACATGILPEISPGDLPIALPVLLPAAVASRARSQDPKSQHDDEADPEPHVTSPQGRQGEGEGEANEEGWSRLPSLDASTQSDWVGPAGNAEVTICRSSSDVSPTGSRQQRSSSGASSIKLQMLTPTIPGSTTVVKADPAWAPGHQLKRGKGKEAEKKKDSGAAKSSVHGRSAAIETVSDAQRVLQESRRRMPPEPEPIVKRHLDALAKKRRLAVNSNQDLLVSGGCVNVPTLLTLGQLVPLRTSVLPQVRRAGTSLGDQRNEVTSDHLDDAEARGDVELPMPMSLMLLAPEELLEQDSALMFGWTSNSRPSQQPNETNEDISFVPEMAQQHREPLAAQDNHTRLRSRFRETVPHRNHREDQAGNTSSLSHQLALASRAPTREEFPLSQAGTIASGQVNHSSTIALVLADPKRKRRLVTENSTSMVEGLVAEGFRVHRLFTSQLEHDGLALSDFCREHKISPQHLASYLHIVSHEQQERRSHVPKGSTTSDSPDVTRDGGLEKSLLRGVHADDVRHVHRVICDYIKGSLLMYSHIKASPSPVDHPSSLLSDMELASAEGKALRERWLAASRADGLTTASFCDLFGIQRLAGALGAWIRDSSRRDFEVERYVNTYLTRRESLKVQFEQLVDFSGAQSVASFCNIHFLSLADVGGWLSGADHFDRQVVRSAWKLVLAADEDQKLKQRRVDAKARSAQFSTNHDGSSINMSTQQELSSATPPRHALKALRRPEFEVKTRRDASDPRPLAGVPKDKFVIESVIAHLHLQDEGDMHRAAIDCRAKQPQSWRDGVAAAVEKQTSTTQPLPLEMVMRQRRDLRRLIGAPMADGYWKDVDPWAKGSYRSSKVDKDGDPSHLSAYPTHGVPILPKVSEQTLQSFLISRRVGTAARGAVLDAIEKYAPDHRQDHSRSV